MHQQDGKSSEKTKLEHPLESTGSESTQQTELTHLNPQAVPRDIGTFQIIALGFNIPNSWLAVAVALSAALAAGGPVSLIYGNFVITAMYGAAAVTLAELASVYPTAGGQYHFASIMAPKRFNRSISYICGMIATVSWIICSASVASVTSLSIAAIAEFYNGFQASAWQLFLISQGLNVLCLLYNLFLLKKTHWIHDAACKSLSTCICREYETIPNTNYCCISLSHSVDIRFRLCCLSRPRRQAVFELGVDQLRVFFRLDACRVLLHRPHHSCVHVWRSRRHASSCGGNAGSLQNGAKGAHVHHWNWLLFWTGLFRGHGVLPPESGYFGK